MSSCFFIDALTPLPDDSYMMNYFAFYKSQFQVGLSIYFMITDGYNYSDLIQSSKYSQCLTNELECETCLDDMRIRPMGKEFDQYLPFFLNQNPGEECLSGGKALFSGSVKLVKDSKGDLRAGPTFLMAYRNDTARICLAIGVVLAPLHKALSHVKLSRCYADPNARDNWNFTPLHKAAIKGKV
uniref:Uncharacterized protein n=1 Tax=Tetranychus urticae TaxID=32264 RepID=T1K446_TETUR